MEEIKVVDVSKWNPYFDPALFVSKGISHCFIRAGYGTGHIDPYAESHYKKALAAGMHVGFYWFSYARNTYQATQEAQCLLDFCKDKIVEMPLVFDFESASMQNRVMTAEAVSALAIAFLDTIEKAGYYGMLYSNEDFIKRYWNAEVKKRYDIWYARYNSNSKYAEKYFLWQYTSSFKMNGKNYDMSRAKRDYVAIIKKAGLNHVS